MLAGCTILDRLSKDPEPLPQDAAADAPAPPSNDGASGADTSIEAKDASDGAARDGAADPDSSLGDAGTASDADAADASDAADG